MPTEKPRIVIYVTEDQLWRLKQLALDKKQTLQDLFNPFVAKLLQPKPEQKKR